MIPIDWKFEPCQIYYDTVRYRPSMLPFHVFSLHAGCHEHRTCSQNFPAEQAQTMPREIT